MKRNDGPVSDTVVDAYRDALQGKPARPITPGAGVRPELICKPGKRLRNWHRNAKVDGGLRKYARALATTSGDNKATALKWLAAKGISL